MSTFIQLHSNLQELIIEDCAEERAVLTVKSNVAISAKLKWRGWQSITHSEMSQKSLFSLNGMPDLIQI